MIAAAPSPQGTTQVIPASLAAATELRLERRALQRPGDPFTVLLIEDDVTVRALVRRYLTHDGYMVLEAEDGQSGLELLERQAGRVDVVLTDIDMPRIDGLTVAAILAALRPHIGVIIMSGTTILRELDEGVRALSPPPFLAKPFTPEHLADVLNDELARVQELMAVAESTATASRDLAVERRIMHAGDLVGSALRLQTRRSGGVHAPREALRA